MADDTTIQAAPDLTDTEIISALEKFDSGQEIETLPSANKEGDRTPSVDGKSKNDDGSKGPEPKDVKPTPEPGKSGTDAKPTGAQEQKPDAKPKPEEKPKADEKPKAEADLEDKPGDSKYVKAQKAAARLEKTWQNVNARKEELARQEAELTQRAQQLEQQKAQLQQQKPAQRDPQKFTSKDYKDAAVEFRKQGETEKAAAAEQLAVQAEQTEQAELQQTQQQQQQQFLQHWNKELALVMKDPEYEDLKDVNSPLGKNMTAVLQKAPFLSQMPTGCRDAAWVAKAFTVAELVPGLQAKVSEQQKEIERLQKLTAIEPGPVNTAGKDKLGEKSRAESEADLVAKLEEFDQSNPR